MSELTKVMIPLPPAPSTICISIVGDERLHRKRCPDRVHASIERGLTGGEQKEEVETTMSHPSEH